jgi:RNA-dependent RNA polymerase
MNIVTDRTGRWTTYRLSFDASTLTGTKFEDFEGALADHGIGIIDHVSYNLVPKAPAPIWDSLQEDISYTHPHLNPSRAESALDELFTDQIILSFSVRYQLEVCLSLGYLKEHTITRAFLMRLASLDSAEAVRLLEKIADKQITHYNPMDIFSVRIKGRLTKNVPGYCVLARAVNITPTMIHVATPSVETSNRIIRKFASDGDRFIRVKFTDEKTEGRLGYQGKRSDTVFDRITRALKHGIVVAGRYYVFLAFGNSQFRENGAYFYAPTVSQSADDIRRSLGSFDHIKTIAKYGARLGQCFSTTRAIKSISIVIEKIPDIERNGYNFSDGVGKLSLFLAQMAATELGLQSAFEDPPSLFQFRLAGCKGVLALDPGISKNVVQIRSSQYKFDAVNDGLEIIRASSFATAYFNRQLIIVLSTLGVPDQTFIRKQQDMVNDLERATKDEDVAIQKLQRNVDLNQISIVMVGMILDGFMRVKDPFMMSMLQLWRAYHIKFLKEKARIFIENGAFLLGCVDETATLQGHYDVHQRVGATKEEKLSILPEIFLRISDPEKPSCYKVIQGICLLARNPSLHVGDIRVVRAVDVSALHHLKNVVVLPQTGDRDLANMCSGGDLDGDDYLVMWDDDFLPESINETPMDFTPETPIPKDEPVTISDVATFFVTYMKNDSLGKIAHAHLAQADCSSEGVKNSKCIELAELHSQAVDYPKSGIPATMTKELRPKRWPHFMEKKYLTKNQVYRSTNVLGKLYDQVKLVDFEPQYHNEFDSRILNAFKLEDSMLCDASSLKVDYDTSIKRLMAKHDVQTEFEVWSIFVLSHNQETRDYQFAEEFGKTVEAIKQQYRESCRKAAGASTMPFIAAMYTVTAREMSKALEECRKTNRKPIPEQMPFMSFPWIFANELGRIATGSTNDRQGAAARHTSANKAQGHKAQAGFVMEPGMGDIETKDGITHYGELLKLDFGLTMPSLPTENYALPTKTLSAARTIHKEGKGPSPAHTKILSLEKGENEEQAAVHEYGSDRTGSESIPESRSTAATETDHDGETKVVKVATGKGSALSRLAALLGVDDDDDDDEEYP